MRADLWLLNVSTLFAYLHSTFAIQLQLGDCPLYYEEPCSLNVVRFILSSKMENGTKYKLLDPFVPELPSHYNKFVPLKIVIHGYGGLTVDTSTTNVTKAYQDVGYNVIIVDWEPLASIPCYPTAYLNTWHVGKCLAVLVVSLLPLGISPEFIHAIGFSLGAHIAGIAGTHLKNTLGSTFYRITGLDPALPFFATLKNEWKLDATDADFVDIIHTSAGTFGKLEASGDVDFYVNGGSLQPYCFSKRHPPLCSHIMAGIYFAESIRSSVHGGNSFVGIRCDNLASYMLGFCMSGKTAIMGENTYTTSRGVYYLTTDVKTPFALGFISYIGLK